MLTLKRVTTAEELQCAVDIQLAVFFEEQGIAEALCHDGNDDAWHVLALDGDQPVATARMRRGKAGEGEIARVAVLPSHRSAGIGRDLVLALEKIAAHEGLIGITLHPHDYLEPFYARLGYERLDDWADSVAGHELIRMRKRITR